MRSAWNDVRCGRRRRWAGSAGTFAAYVDRRAAREPLQHITGRAFFRHLELAVGPGVFVPRPETEVVAGAAIDAARADRPTPVVVDLGTGSGAIALAVATEVPGSRVHAVEADPDAFAWAARNCAGSGVDLRLGDMADGLPRPRRHRRRRGQQPAVHPARRPDPRPRGGRRTTRPLALWSGADGLDAMRVVEVVAARLLRPGGTVVAEHADLQGGSAPEVFRHTGRLGRRRRPPRPRRPRPLPHRPSARGAD